MWQSIIPLLVNKFMGQDQGQDFMQQPMMAADAAAQRQMAGPEPYQQPQMPMQPQQGGMFNQGFNVDKKKWELMQQLAQQMGGMGG